MFAVFAHKTEVIKYFQSQGLIVGLALGLMWVLVQWPWLWRIVLFQHAQDCYLFIFSCWTPTSPTSLPFILGVTCQAWLVMVATIVVLYVPLMQASPCLMLKPRWWHPSPLDDWRRTRIRSPCTSAFGQRDCMKLGGRGEDQTSSKWKDIYIYI